MNDQQITIDETLVHRLMERQFPLWKDLSIQPVALSGWDNRTFHLGQDMLIRMPSREAYASQVEKEQRWLPRLAPLLPLQIPTPLALGEPAEGYPWKVHVHEGPSLSLGSAGCKDRKLKGGAHSISYGREAASLRDLRPPPLGERYTREHVPPK